MTITDLLSERLVLARMRSVRPSEVVPELGGHLAAHHPEVGPQGIIRVLEEREQLGSTAVGDGIAIPHAKLDTIDRTLACLGRSRRGIDFGAPDGQPTYLFFTLVAPSDAAGEHLEILARISRLLRRPEIRKRLLGARTAADMYRIIATEEAAG